MTGAVPNGSAVFADDYVEAMLGGSSPGTVNPGRPSGLDLLRVNPEELERLSGLLASTLKAIEELSERIGCGDPVARFPGSRIAESNTVVAQALNAAIVATADRIAYMSGVARGSAGDYRVADGTLRGATRCHGGPSVTSTRSQIELWKSSDPTVTATCLDGMRRSIVDLVEAMRNDVRAMAPEWSGIAFDAAAHRADDEYDEIRRLAGTMQAIVDTYDGGAREHVDFETGVAIARRNPSVGVTGEVAVDAPVVNVQQLSDGSVRIVYEARNALRLSVWKHWRPFIPRYCTRCGIDHGHRGQDATFATNAMRSPR